MRSRQTRLSPMPRLLQSAVLLSATLLGGCSLGPFFAKPEPPVPAQYDSQADGIGIWPDATWWRAFGSAELDRLMVEAEANNLDLKAAVIRVAQARASAIIAGAAIYPTLTADATSSRVSRETRGQRQSTNTYQGGLAVGYEVDLFGANYAAADAATTRVESSRYDREALALTVTANVAVTYFQLLALRERIALSNESITNAVRLLGLLEDQRRAGALSDLEVAQQRASVAQQRASISALRQAEREALSALALLSGRLPQGFAVEGQRLSALSEPAVVSGLTSELLQRRPDVRRVESNLRAANLDVVVARAQRFPSIQLTLDGGTVSTALSNLLSPGSFLLTLSGGLVAPIFAGGRLKGQETLTRERYNELVEGYRLVALTAFRDVEDALSGASLYRQQYAFAREARNQSREAYRLAEVRFRAGTVDFLTVLDTQRAIIFADDSVVQARFNLLAALADLYKALGGGWSGTLR
jgi:multidrug efflux system outer membrane protein